MVPLEVQSKEIKEWTCEQSINIETAQQYNQGE